MDQNQVCCMTFQQLQTAVEKLAATAGITAETKIFLDTGWDSLQEVAPDAIKVGEAQKFAVQDELTKEFFGGYALLKKAEKMQAAGPTETVIIIENQY